ncbi:flowering-promoting factor 1-like protein 4 [Wolffia australiana]
MSQIWEYKDGARWRWRSSKEDDSGGQRWNVLVDIPTNEVITSYEVLEQKLLELGWERYLHTANLLQFHKPSSVDLISVPSDFAKLKSMHMYDIAVKTRYVFQVRDA